MDRWTVSDEMLAMRKRWHRRNVRARWFCRVMLALALVLLGFWAWRGGSLAPFGIGAALWIGTTNAFLFERWQALARELEWINLDGLMLDVLCWMAAPGAPKAEILAVFLKMREAPRG